MGTLLNLLKAYWPQIAAFVGALAVMGFILLVAQRVSSMATLIIAGVMVGYACGAATDFLITFADDQNIVTEQRVESGTVASQEAADNLARMTGERWARPQQSVEVTVPARSDLDYRDLISLGRVQANVAGTFRVSSWSLDMRGPDTGPALMKVTMMTRQADT